MPGVNNDWDTSSLGWKNNDDDVAVDVLLGGLKLFLNSDGTC